MTIYVPKRVNYTYNNITILYIDTIVCFRRRGRLRGGGFEPRTIYAVIRSPMPSNTRANQRKPKCHN